MCHTPYSAIEKYPTGSPGDRTIYQWDHRNRLTSVAQYSGYVSPTNPGTRQSLVTHNYDYANRWVYEGIDADGTAGVETQRVFV